MALRVPVRYRLEKGEKKSNRDMRNKTTFTCHEAALTGLHPRIRGDQALAEALIFAGVGWGEVHGLQRLGVQSALLAGVGSNVAIGTLNDLWGQLGPELLPVIWTELLARDGRRAVFGVQFDSYAVLRWERPQPVYPCGDVSEIAVAEYFCNCQVCAVVGNHQSGSIGEGVFFFHALNLT